MNETNKNVLKYSYLLIVILLYFIGFFLRENIAGGAEADFLDLTWPLISAFKINFLDTLLNYGSFGEGNLPLFHILNAYFNPFNYSQFVFQGSITAISFLNVVFFSQVIREKYKLKKIDALIYASIFLILPFFRSSAFWGITENFGWLFLILSIKYLNLYESKNYKNIFFIIFLVCFFSSLALYTRQYLVFFPIFVLIKNLIIKNYQFLKISIFYYLIFSIPGFLFLFYLGNVLKTDEGSINLLLNYHNPKFILKNLIIFSSFVCFYFFPFEIVKFLKKRKIEKNNLLFFLSIIIILLIFNFFELFDYLKLIELGGGAPLKINFILFGDNLIFYIIFSALGIFFIYNYSKISKTNLVLFFSTIIFCFPKYILQEYFEPLLIILLLSLMDHEKNFKEYLKTDKMMFICISYFLIYLISSFYFRYFLK